MTVTDIAGNSASDDITFAWDTTEPTVALSSSAPDPTNGFIFVVAQFSETVTDFNMTDIAVGNGVVDSFVAVDGDTYNFNVDPTDGASVAVTIDVPVATSMDVAGNTNTPSNQIARTSDTVAPAVSSITTTDANLDGTVDTATIVFTEAMRDSTFNFADFTIGGIPATNFSTGITENDDTVVLSHAGVAGTNAKTVAYVPGTAITDLAGNIRIAFTSGSIDAAKPVLLSARTVTTTSIEATFSEDLDGGTVNGSGNEFTVSGQVVSAAVEHVADDGRVVITVDAMPTDATPVVTYTSNGPLNDRAPVPNTAVTPVSVTAVDGVAPVLTAVSISSNNDGDSTVPEWAKVGDIARIIFTSSEPIAMPVVTIAGRPATSIEGPGIGNSWAANLNSFTGIEINGVVSFSIAFADMAPIPNAGTSVTVTGDGSFVFFDSVNPTVDAGIDREVNAPVIPQGATASDAGSPVTGSGVNTYAWMQIPGPGLGAVAFSNPSGTGTSVDTTISADTDGTYVLRLTVTDNVGNSAYDEITFIWDTTNPEPLTASPSDGATGVAIAAGMATVTYDEPIVLLDSSRVLLVNDSTGDSYKGVVAVSGLNPAVLNIAYSGLANGTKYRINVKPNALEDVAGNNLASNFISYFTTEADIAVPVINSLSAGSITETGATLSATTNESATCRYAATDSSYASMTAMGFTGGTSHSQAITGLSASTGYTYFVRCQDVSGNTMTTSGVASFTTSAPAADTTPPAVPVFTTVGTGIDANTYTIAGTVADDGGSRTITLYNGLDVAGSATIPTGDTTWAIVVLLVQDAWNWFTATTTDEAGNVSAPNFALIIIEATATGDTDDPAVPEITTADAIVDANTYTITGTADADLPADGTRTITVSRNGTVVGSLALLVGETDWSFVSPLLQNTANSFTANSTDVAGNTSDVSNAVVITEATVADITAPVISSIHPTSITETSININWQTDEASDSVVQYGLTSEYTNSSSSGSNVISHTRPLTGLLPGTTYHYRVRSEDAFGNQATSDDFVFTTAASTTDIISPVITNIQVTSISSVSATVTWTTNEDSTSQVEYGASGYGFRRSGTGMVTTHSVSLSVLSPVSPTTSG